MRKGSVTVFVAVVFEGEDLVEDEATIERLSRAVVEEFRGHVWGETESAYVDPLEFDGESPDCIVAYPHDSILVGRSTVGDAFDF